MGRAAKLAIVVALGAGVGCKDGERKPSDTGSGSAARPAKLSDAEQILVLEAALEKAKKELAQLLAATPQDGKAIAAKRGAIDAVEQTLATLRRRRQ